MNPLQLSQDRLEHLRHLEAHLCEQIRGQDHVISRVVPVLHRGELGLSTPGRPRGSFLFLGPTGVGKTELALAFTRYLFGYEKLFRFDMSEYQTQESLGLLLGGKLGEIGLLGLAVAKSSTGTLLFDEIEKAHPRVLDIFLQILDAARVTMANGETLDLSGFYIVFTSNLGGADILNLQHSTFATMERHVLARLSNLSAPNSSPGSRKSSSSTASATTRNWKSRNSTSIANSASCVVRVFISPLTNRSSHSSCSAVFIRVSALVRCATRLKDIYATQSPTHCSLEQTFTTASSSCVAMNCYASAWTRFSPDLESI